MSKYIVCKRFRTKGIDGNFNLPFNTEIEEEGGILYYNEKRICLVSSQNAYDHFSRNDDGHGNERFAIIQEIKSKIADYVNEYNEEVAAINNGDLTDEQKEEELANVVDKCSIAYDSVRSNQQTSNLLQGNFNVWNFNFYNADINVLTIVKSLVDGVEE